jgi:hypothetical protein
MVSIVKTCLNPGDPLLRQVLPLAEEDINHAGFIADPLGEASHAAVAGVLHKYHGRALLITTGACAIHCRYCFRRHFPYADQIAAKNIWKPALTYVAEDTSIRELILSGGATAAERASPRARGGGVKQSKCSDGSSTIRAIRDSPVLLHTLNHYLFRKEVINPPLQQAVV